MCLFGDVESSYNRTLEAATAAWERYSPDFFNNTESHIALFIITCRGDDCATHRCVVLNINAGWGYYADTHSDTLVHVWNFPNFSNTYFLQLLFLFVRFWKSGPHRKIFGENATKPLIFITIKINPFVSALPLNIRIGNRIAC